MYTAGLSYNDWRAMVRWQRLDYIARCHIRAKEMGEQLKEDKSISGILGFVVRRVLRI